MTANSVAGVTWLRPVLVAVTLVLVATFGTAAEAADPTPTPPRVSFQGCPAIVFYGVRGSGEPFDDGQLALGFPGKRLFDALAARYGPGIGAMANSYPAPPVAHPSMIGKRWIGASVKQGAVNTIQDLTSFLRGCTTSRAFIVAYSQGTLAARIGMFFLRADVQQRIAAVLLIGDPNFQAGEPNVITTGGFRPNRDGLLRSALRKAGRKPPHPIGRRYSGRVTSWCHHLDAFCQGRAPRSNLFGPHTNYTVDTAELNAMAGELIKRLG